jgi:DHA2 family metal-tetracycline-proton antiporter-like MFS transporter
MQARTRNPAPVAPDAKQAPAVASASVLQGAGAAPSTRLFMLVVAAAVFVAVLTGSMVNVVLPLMRAEFGASAAHIGWVVTGYSLAYAVGVPLFGRVSDLFGVRRVFVLGLVASSVGIGSSVGPVVGGAVAQFLDWRALFLGSFALALLLLPFANRVLPAGGTADDRRFDLPGGVLLGLGAGLFLFGITQGQAAGFAAPSSWGSFLGMALAAAGFVWRINHVSHPFVPPALFRNRGYVAAVGVGFFAMFGNLAALVVVPLLLVEVNGLSPGAAGLVLTPGAVALALLSPVAGRRSDRLGVRPPIVAGLGTMALAVLFLSSVAGASPVLLAVGTAGLGAGLAWVQSPASNAAANALPQEAVGVGMGLFAGAFFLGAGTGPALIGAVLAARQAAGAAALNPLYGFAAAPFSDAFLAMGLALAAALVVASGLQTTPATSAASPQPGPR